MMIHIQYQKVIVHFKISQIKNKLQKNYNNNYHQNKIKISYLCKKNNKNAKISIMKNNFLYNNHNKNKII